MQACSTEINCSIESFYGLAKDYYGNREPMSLDGSLLGHATRTMLRLGTEAAPEESLAALFFDALSDGSVSIKDLEHQGVPQAAIDILKVVAPMPGESFSSDEKIQIIANSSNRAAIKVALAHTLDHLSEAALAYATPQTSERYFAAKKALLARLPQSEYRKMVAGNLH